MKKQPIRKSFKEKFKLLYVFHYLGYIKIHFFWLAERQCLPLFLMKSTFFEDIITDFLCNKHKIVISVDLIPLKNKFATDRIFSVKNKIKSFKFISTFFIIFSRETSWSSKFIKIWSFLYLKTITKYRFAKLWEFSFSQKTNGIYHMWKFPKSQNRNFKKKNQKFLNFPFCYY